MGPGGSIRFAYRVMSPAERVPAGEQVLWDNGYWFLFVDDACHYYVRFEGGLDDGTISNRAVWHPAFEGDLTAAEALELGRDVRYRDWSDLDGGRFSEPGAFDLSPWQFSDGTHRFSCAGDCSARSSDAWKIRNATLRWVERLRGRGTPVTTEPMRGVAVREEDTWMLHAPPERVETSTLFATSISPAEATTRSSYGMGILTAPGEAEMWRALRAQYLALGEGWWYQYLPVEDGASRRYFVFVRDTIPLESDDGIVQAW